MRTVVREQIWPLETLLDELGWEGLTTALGPVQEQVKAQGLWAAHLDPELGGQGYGQVKLGLMHESGAALPKANGAIGVVPRISRATRRSWRWPARPSRRTATCTRCWRAI